MEGHKGLPVVEMELLNDFLVEEIKQPKDLQEMTMKDLMNLLVKNMIGHKGLPVEEMEGRM